MKLELLTNATVVDDAIRFVVEKHYSHIGGTTGAYIDTTHIFYDEEKRTFIELKLKESCFYTDWDEDNKTWKYDVATDSDQLRKKVKYFEERLAKIRGRE